MADVSVEYSEYSDEEDVYMDEDDSGSEFDENSPAVKAGKGKKAATVRASIGEGNETNRRREADDGRRGGGDGDGDGDGDEQKTRD